MTLYKILIYTPLVLSISTLIGYIVGNEVDKRGFPHKNDLLRGIFFDK